MPTLTQQAAHIRNRIKARGIKAKVSLQGDAIRVSVPAFEFIWPEDHKREILMIARVNHLTFAAGLAIDVELHAEIAREGENLFFWPQS